MNPSYQPANSFTPLRGGSPLQYIRKDLEVYHVTPLIIPLMFNLKSYANQTEKIFLASFCSSQENQALTKTLILCLLPTLLWTPKLYCDHFHRRLLQPSAAADFLRRLSASDVVVWNGISVSSPLGAGGTGVQVPYIACLHDQNKGGILEGRLLSSQSEQSEKFSKSSDWLEKSQPSKKAAFVLIM